jgi:hypothetical protein
MLRSLTHSVDFTDSIVSDEPESTPRLTDVSHVTSPRLTLLESSLNEASNDTVDDDLIDLELTFHQYNALYEAGIISTIEMSTGRVKRTDLDAINAFLKEIEELDSRDKSADDHNVAISDNEYLLTVDCGLKRVDSKRYRRDYVVNREPQVGQALDLHQTDRRSSITGHRNSCSQVCKATEFSKASLPMHCLTQISLGKYLHCKILLNN